MGKWSEIKAAKERGEYSVPEETQQAEKAGKWSRLKEAKYNTDPETLLETEALTPDRTGQAVDARTSAVPKKAMADYEGAGIGSEFKAGFVDDPMAKVRIYAAARFPDMPEAERLRRYGFKNGEIVFVDLDGQVKRETPDTTTGGIKRFIGETGAAAPEIVGGAIGTALGGPIGAGIGSGIGEAARKTIGAAMGDDQDAIDWIGDIGVATAMGAASDVVGRMATGTTNARRMRKGGALRFGVGDDITRGYISPAKQLEADRIRNLAKQIGIDVPPHQLYNSESMTNWWKYLRKHPITADAVRQFEDMQADQIEGAIEKHAGKMLRPDDSVSTVGKDLNEAATKTATSMKRARADKVGPMFRDALHNKQVPQYEMDVVISDIDQLIKSVPPSLQPKLKKIRDDMMAPAPRPPRGYLESIEQKIPDYPMLFENTRNAIKELRSNRRLSEAEAQALNRFDRYFTDLTKGKGSTHAALGASKTVRDAIARSRGDSSERVLRKIQDGIDADLQKVADDVWSGNIVEHNGAPVNPAKLSDELEANISKLASMETASEPDLDAITAALKDRGVPTMRVTREGEDAYRERMIKDYKRILKQDPPTRKVADSAQIAEITARNEEIQKILSEVSPGQDVSAIVRAYKKASFPPESNVPDTDMERLHVVKTVIDDFIEDASRDATAMPPGAKSILNQRLVDAKNRLVGVMDKASPEYAIARQKWAENSEPIKRLNRSIIGELSRMEADGVVDKATKKLFSPQKMTPFRMKHAKTLLEKQDPGIMRRSVGAYVQDTFEMLREAQGGDVINAAGKMRQQIFGSKKQRAILRAALDENEYKGLEDLMEVLQATARGRGSESMTMPFAEMQRQLEGSAGGKISGVVRGGLTLGKSIRDGALNKWNDIIMRGNQEKLFVALTDPEVVSIINKMKPLSPTSKKYIRSFAALTALIGAETGINTFERANYEDEAPAMQTEQK
jgi:hypothetical protein